MVLCRIAKINGQHSKVKSELIGRAITCNSQPKICGPVTYSEVEAPLYRDVSFQMQLQIKQKSRDNNRSIIENIQIQYIVENVGLD